MAKNEDTFDDLISSALENAIEDRDRAVEAFEKTKAIYDIDLNNTQTLQGLMLMGQNVSKLLEISQKSNEQIIKLAQIKKGATTKKDPMKPVSMDEIRAMMSDNLDS